jgi:ribonucleoside-diphosphate reductase alpha chain
MQDQKATTTGTTTAATAGKKVVSSKKTSRDHRGSRVVDEKHARPGLTFERYFTREGVDPFDTVEWELRDAVISGADGKVFFEQRQVEFPKSWSQTATNVVVQKYFRGTLGTPGRERSVRQMVGRVADTIYGWGKEDGYFKTEKDAWAFRDELVHLLLHQKMAFNSPVWFNVGVEAAPQCSACFINSVEDSMASILTLAKTEGMLFKYGSGTGSNLSGLRSSREHLNGGGTASGPVSFMRGFDAFAGAIKSGGKTRRAAKMVILDSAHPDIVDFIDCKAVEEKKAWTLIDAGYDGGFNVPGGAYDSVNYQNANHSVRVTDDFMTAVLRDGEWTTHAVTDGRIVETPQARATSCARCPTPPGSAATRACSTTPPSTTGTRAATRRASTRRNPCSEYMFLDDSACNLASLNLRKFQHADGEFNVEDFRRAVQTTMTAMEIIIDNSAYPTERIAQNSWDYRPLGLGFANLGALLMSRGLPYDSAPGRAYSAAPSPPSCVVRRTSSRPASPPTPPARSRATARTKSRSCAS